VKRAKDQFVAPKRLGKEAKARGQRSTHGSRPPLSSDASRLLHELQVHQAELEMQNDELRRVQSALEDSRDRFIKLYDFAPVGYLTLDKEGVVHEANLTAARLLGLDRAEILRRKFDRVITAGSQDTFYLHRQQLFTSGTKQSCELILRKPGGQTFIAALVSVVIGKGEAVRQWLAALSDITERKRAESELKENQARLSGIVRSAMDGIISADGQFRIILFNEAAQKMFGFSAAQVIGRPMDFLIPDRFRAAYATHLRRFGETGPPNRMMGSQGNILGLRSDGTEFPIETSISRIELGGQTIFTVILRDISERLKGEVVQRQLARRLAEVQEQERARLSRELHDQTCQEITALKLQLESLIADPAVSPPAQERLDNLAGLARNLARNVRQIAWELRPSVLDDLGLDKALRRRAAEWSEQTRVPVDYQSRGLLTSRDPMVEITLYRIALEALQNIGKHAGARRVTMQLQWRRNDVRLIAQDDGQGFVVPPSMNVFCERGQLGLAGMRERAALVGGTVDINSSPGRGTAITVSIPLPHTP
jgi:PAS domain S-box-containing protein